MIELAYTFGNHMHWVDMEWLWGYDVLPGSTRDMLKYCRETGAKGNVNFDGIGYEKMAAECPEALLELRQAVLAGQIEPVGCSYGQPYGQFQGGESNIRQRIYGTRAVMRLLGVRPRTFWEEEFDWFPQLPQMLTGCGYQNASLYFQWTWHTPEMPVEKAPAVWWEGIDGSRLRAATRNRLNLHQWPEDFQILLDELAAESGDHVSTPSGWRLKGSAYGQESSQECCGDSLQGKPLEALSTYPPLIQQWLELMPSPDWMCRAELMIPKLKELLADKRFKVNFCTLGEYLQSLPGEELPTRRYQPEETWHGMSLGKNGDRAVRESLEVERQIQSAEALQTVLSCFGRPYANWDVYPVWELEEAWRNLLAAQHHDNHECEGLCGHVAVWQLQTASSIVEEGNRGIAELAARAGLQDGDEIGFNPTGTEMVRYLGDGERYQVVIPPFGYAIGGPQSQGPVQKDSSRKWSLSNGIVTCSGSSTTLEVNLNSSQMRLSSGSNSFEMPMPKVYGMRDGLRVEESTFRLWAMDNDGPLECEPDFSSIPSGDTCYWIEPFEDGDAISLCASVEPLGELSPGLKQGYLIEFDTLPFGTTVVADSPYAIHEVKPGRPAKRKYPTGDWMTSEQWFEEVESGFLSQSFVDVVGADGSGLLIAHDGSPQWWFTETGIAVQALTIDPWDERKSEPCGRIDFKLIPHGQISNAQRRDLAIAHLYRRTAGRSTFPPVPAATANNMDDSRISPTADIPREFSFARCHGKGTRMVALYREHENYSGRDLPDYAGRGMGYPVILRLVEFNGEPDEVTLDVFGTIERAVKTNLLGESLEQVLATSANGRSTLNLTLKPREIVTLYLDIGECRKVPRDLDAKRSVWATVHRQDS